MNTMFDTLLQLPLFQGLAQEDFTNILGKVKLHFTKHKSGDIIISSGTACDRFIFTLKGEVTSITATSSESYSILEYNSAPYLIEPQSMFGMNTSYVATYIASTELHTVSIDKSFVLNQLFDYDIFRLNYMNIISNRAQQLNTRLWNDTGNTLEERICLFILNHIERPFGEKILKIKMEELGRIVNENRITISKALNNLQEQGLLKLHRGEIVIPQAEKLIPKK